MRYGSRMPSPADFSHHVADTPRLRIHYVRAGDRAGRPALILQHGWPEFWYAFHRNIPALAERYDVIVPDLRGFGDTEDPSGMPAIRDYGDDMLALADHLGLKRFGLVTHDVGAWIGQDLGRRAPERLTGLFFFGCSNPGVGARWAAPDHHIEVWYQAFHRLPMAHLLVGHSRDTIRIYLQYFLSHWASDPHAFDADLDAWVDAYAKPGRVEGSFKWYSAMAEDRLRQAREGPPKLDKIRVPARSLWGADDPVNRPEWRDRLPDYFADIKVDVAPAAGHFVHYEQPELANREILAFFEPLA
jgi:pimeloyl-ACP methyl ester carboxylesterase